METPSPGTWGVPPRKKPVWGTGGGGLAGRTPAPTHRPRDGEGMKKEGMASY